MCPRPLCCSSWACPRWTGAHGGQGSSLLVHALAPGGHVGPPLPKTLVAKAGAEHTGGPGLPILHGVPGGFLSFSRLLHLYITPSVTLSPHPSQRGPHWGGEIECTFTLNHYFWQLKTVLWWESAGQLTIDGLSAWLTALDLHSWALGKPCFTFHFQVILSSYFLVIIQIILILLFGGVLFVCLFFIMKPIFVCAKLYWHKWDFIWQCTSEED